MQTFFNIVVCCFTVLGIVALVDEGLTRRAQLVSETADKLERISAVTDAAQKAIAKHDHDLKASYDGCMKALDVCETGRWNERVESRGQGR